MVVINNHITGRRQSHRYQVPWRAVEVKTNTLNCIQKPTGNQYTSLDGGVTWVSQGSTINIQATRFWTSYSFWMLSRGSPILKVTEWLNNWLEMGDAPYVFWRVNIWFEPWCMSYMLAGQDFGKYRGFLHYLPWIRAYTSFILFDVVKYQKIASLIVSKPQRNSEATKRRSGSLESQRWVSGYPTKEGSLFLRVPETMSHAELLP